MIRIKIGWIVLLLVASATIAGCERNRVTVINPDRSEPTSEQIAEYERKKLAMFSERD